VLHQELPYEIRDVSDADGGVHLELYTAGKRVATARAQADVLAQMTASLGMSRDDVRGVLERALVDELKHQLAKVEVAAPRPVSPDGLRFISPYVYREGDAISSGVVWYDVPSSSTGPDDLPAVVRNKMRFEVHRKLTENSPNALGIVELLK
jgi:bifunctional DNA-binding transcriptional regulator/antitoxin component of YhaV-PrlF toxin-antitoxin module